MFEETTHIEEEILVFSEEEFGGRVSAHLTFPNPSHLVIKDRKGHMLEEGKDYVVKGNDVELFNRSLFYYHADWLHNENVPQVIRSENEIYNIKDCLILEAEYLRSTQFLATYDCEKAKIPSPVSDWLCLPQTYQKLKEQKRLKIMLFGDSISNAANSSWEMGYVGYEHWFETALKQVRELYGAEIIWKNVSRSGYGTEWGMEAVQEKFEGEHPDLVVVAFGMNDASAGMSVETFTENTRNIMEQIRELFPETEFILIATPVPNRMWTDAYKEQKNLIRGLRTLEQEGVTVLNMTSVFLWLLEKKKYIEISGNHVNHPNDFSYRFYTEAMIELFKTLKRKTENRLDFTPYFEKPELETADLSGLSENLQAGYLKTVVHGQMRKTFVYLGVPKTGTRPYPAVVLAHGAGGNAFSEWVENWTKRGYIALAVDLNGTHFTDGDLLNRKENPEAGKIGIGSFDCVEKDPYDSWTYYGVVQLLAAHSYLRSLTQTDPTRTGIVGISWGGVLSMMAIGVDKRFSAAAIIYSSGFITDDLLGQETGLFGDVKKKQFYDTWLDPANYICGTEIPVCFNAGLLDGAFSFLNRQRTWRLLGRTPELAIKKEVYHDNESNFLNKNVLAFMDDCFMGTKNRAGLEASISDGVCHLEFDGEYTSAEVLVTDAKGEDIHNLDWRSIPVTLSKGTADCPIPEDAKYGMAVVYYGDELYTSSEVMENDKANAYSRIYQ